MYVFGIHTFNVNVCMWHTYIQCHIHTWMHVCGIHVWMTHTYMMCVIWCVWYDVCDMMCVIWCVWYDVCGDFQPLNFPERPTATHCNTLQHTGRRYWKPQCVAGCFSGALSVLQCVAVGRKVRCSVLQWVAQCVAVCCSMCCSVSQWVAIGISEETLKFP